MLLQKTYDPLFKGVLFCMEGYSYLHGPCQTLNLSDASAVLLFLSTSSLQIWKDHSLLAHLVLYVPSYICLSLLPKDSKNAEFSRKTYEKVSCLLKHFV